MPHNKNLSDTLDILQTETSGETVIFNDLVEALNRRGFGPLLIAPSALTILPTGAIPGIPALCGIFIILMAGQILIGRHHPWLPKRIKNFSFRRDKMVSAIQKAKPYTSKVDTFLRPRLKFLTQDTATPLVALICVILSLGIVVIGFIPMLPAAISLPILFFGLGISAKDGLMTLLGLFFTLIAPFAVLYLMGDSHQGQITLPFIPL